MWKEAVIVGFEILSRVTEKNHKILSPDMLRDGQISIRLPSEYISEAMSI
jgi:hypothetical protein